MKIAVLCPHVEDIGGVREVVIRLAREHIAIGHRVDVIGREHTRPLDPSRATDGMTLWRVPMAPAPYRGAGRRATKRFARRFARGAWALAARLRALAPDVIAVHCSKFYAPWVTTARLASPAPIVLHLHNADRTADGPPSPFWSRRLLASARHVIAVAPAVAQFAIRMRPSLAGHVSVLRNGVEPAEFEAVVPETRAEPYVLAVGRLASQKGFDILIDALARCRQQVPVIIAGAGPERSALASQATGSGVATRVEWLGEVPREHVKRLLRGAAVVVMPSRFEGNPLIAIEALQAGAPLIASDIAGLPEELRTGETGWLVPPEDPAALAAAIDRLLDDPALARRLGAAAALAAQGMPSWQTVAANALAIYRQVAHSM